MSKMTLREVCKAIGVSRRAIQGYENAGLISETSRNERGYLLYDEKEQEKIKKIKLFQEMGFSIKEIKELQNMYNTELKVELENRVDSLQKENERIKNMIDIAQEMIEKL